MWSLGNVCMRAVNIHFRLMISDVLTKAIRNNSTVYGNPPYLVYEDEHMLQNTASHKNDLLQEQ